MNTDTPEDDPAGKVEKINLDTQSNNIEGDEMPLINEISIEKITKKEINESQKQLIESSQSSLQEASLEEQQERNENHPEIGRNVENRDTGVAKIEDEDNFTSESHHEEPKINEKIVLGVLEAILFASDEPLSLKEIRQLFERDEFKSLNFEITLLEDFVEKIIEKYKYDTFCYELREIAGGYQFFTKPYFGEFVRVAIQAKERRKLSKAALETLSIIAYRQPITKAEIEYIRGVSCDYAIHKLLDKTLIEPGGRAELPGRPLLYKTSQVFLEYFGLKSIQELPKLKELLTENEIPKELFQTAPLAAE